MKMSPNRRLSAVYRKEQREIRACPYRRSEEESEKEKKSSRWSGYLDYLNIFNYFGSSKKKEKEEFNVVVVPEEDFVMTDSEATTTSTEESSSDSSIEITEVAETVEPAAPVEVARPFEVEETVEPAAPVDTIRRFEVAETVERVTPVRPAKSQELESGQTTEAVEPATFVHVAKTFRPVQSINCASSRRPISPSTQTSKPLGQTSSSSTSSSSPSAPFLASTNDEILEWARLKFESGAPFNDDDVLALKGYLDRTRGDMTYEPIKLRFAPRGISLPEVHSTTCSAPDGPSSRQPAPTAPVSVPTSQAANSSPTPQAISYISGFHSSTGLPTFKSNCGPAPRKVLKKNPNGSLTWMGAGSARNVEEERKRPAPSSLPRLDPYKRRRLFERSNAADISRSQAPSNAAEAGPSVPPRPSRSNIIRQHASPHVHNVVNGASPSSRHSSTMPTNLNASGSRNSRPTYTSAFVQEIIEKAPPRPRCSDVVNPYQTGAPVKPLSKPMERKKMSERRSRLRELEKQREAAKARESERKTELTAREIIEATIPKGAKRSLPPPGLTRSRPIDTFDHVVTNKRSLQEPEEELVTKKRRTVTVEEVSDDDDAASRSVPVKPNVIIESRSPSPEPAEGPTRPLAETPSPIELSLKEPSVKGISTFGASTKEQPATVTPAKDSVPKSTVKEVTPKAPSTKESPPRLPHTKEPSSKVPSTKVPSSKAPTNHFTPLLNAKMAGKSSVPREPSKLRTSFLPDDYENEEPKVTSPTPATPVVMTTPGTPLADIQEKKDPKEVALTLPLNELPPFVFKSPPALTTGDHMDIRAAAKALPVTSLPKFDFSKARTSMNCISLPAVPIPTIKAFDFGAAGIKPPTPAGDGQWQCSTCMLQNPITAVEKCTICGSPRPNMEEPKGVTVNGVGGKDASKTPMSPPAVKSFDFAAAGFKPQPVADGQWTCSTCMLQNPPTAMEKCKICDSPRPGMEKLEKPKKPYSNGVARSPISQVNGVSTSTTKPFDFAAAGMKPPAPPSNGSWKCQTCMLQNPANAIEKCKICDSPRPGTEKKAVELPVAPVKPSVPVVTKPFDWAAAGMAPPKMNGNSWTCGTCMLSNPSTETEKCRVCDASRS